MKNVMNLLKNNLHRLLKFHILLKTTAIKIFQWVWILKYTAPDNNKKAETYPNDNTMGLKLLEKKWTVLHFGLNQPGEIEIQFSPIVSFEKAAKIQSNSTKD